MATTGTIFKNMSVLAANLFLATIADGMVYVYFAKETPWDNESLPDTAVHTQNAKNAIRQNIHFLYQLPASSTILGVNRINWTLNTVYAQFDPDDTSLFSKQFYVITSANNVYKCLGNNNGAPATDVPTGTSTNPIITSDGYIWKFMFDLSPTIASQFLTDTIIPVPTGTQKTNNQLQVELSATPTEGSPPQGHGYNAPDELGASIVLAALNIDSLFPETISYRQLGFINGITHLDKTPAEASTYIIDSSNTIDLLSGQLLLNLNTTVVTDPVETIILTVKF